MTNPRLASRYAQSLLDIAEEQNVLPAVVQDMKLISNTIAQSRELEIFLSSPIIKADKKANGLKEIFQSQVNPLTLKFVNLLINKGRESNLFDIAQSFQNLNDEKNKIKKVKATTAIPMNDGIKGTVIAMAQKIVPGYQIAIEEIINPDIIGGYILEVDDKLYDASVRTELNKIKKQFMSNSYEAKM